MEKYVCKICATVYDPQKGDPDSGVAAGTDFDDVPDDWQCPGCSISKDLFDKME